MAFKTYALTVCGVIEMVLFSGVVFGWANMVLILKSEGYFSDLCASVNETIKQNTNGEQLDGCTGQNDRLSLAFTIAVFSFNLAGFVGGVIFDHFGTRVTRLTACFFIFLTGLLALFLEKETANLTFGLVICLGTSGMLVAISVFQIAQLYHTNKLVVSCLLSGALDSSSVVFLVFKVCYDSGASLRWILITYSGVGIVWLAVTTFVFMPKTSFALENANRQEIPIGNMQELGTVNDGSQEGKEPNQPTEAVDGSIKPVKDDEYSNAATAFVVMPKTSFALENANRQEIPVGNMQELGTVNYGSQEGKEPNQPTEVVDGSIKPVKDEEYSNGWRYMRTSRYLWLLYYLSIVQLRLWFFVGSLNTYFVFRTDNDKDKINRYTEIFGIVQFFGFGFAPFAGIIMKLKPKNTTHPYFGPLCSFIITNGLNILLGGLVLVPILEVQYLSFVVQVAMRAFLYGSFISFVLHGFPNIHYGKLYGVGTTIGAIVNLLQYPAFIILDGSFNGDPFWVNLGFLTLSFTGFGLPLYLWLSHKEEREITTSF